jgi:beta-fructofuranosidase
MFALDGTWVLLVSVWDTEPRDAVVYALGDYDGRRFTARSWGRFSGAVLYATSAFLDAAGRRCAISWARESAAAAPGATWMGALSLPHVLRVDGDRLRVAQHPSLELLRGPALPATGTAVTAGAAADVVVDVACPVGGSVRVAVGGPAEGAEVEVDGRAGRVRLRSGGETLAAAAYDARDRDRLRLVLDADLVEVTAGGLEGVVVGRLPSASARRVEAQGAGSGRILAVRAWELRGGP